MSTNTRQTTEPAPTTDRQPTTAAESNDHPGFSESWVKRCQRQFDAGRTDRLHNLTDEENHAMPEGA